MSIQKNVAGQRLHWIMVDATDFATPEAGINTTNQYLKDNGGWSTCSNTESEMSSGLYRITLAATETNAAVVTYKFTGAGCAKQFITVYPEAGYAAGVSDIISTLAGTVGGKITSILEDTKTTIPATLSDLNSGLDVIFNQVASILVDTNATLQNQVASILEDTKTTIPATLSDVNSGLDLVFNRVASILIDTSSTLLNLETSTVNYTSQTLSTVDAAVVTTIGNKITSILTDTNATLQNQIASILVDTNATLQNQVASILEDTKTTIPDTLSDLNSGLDLTFTRVQSILVDSGSTLLNLATSTVNYASQVLSTVDAAVVTTIGNKITSILTDTGATLDSAIQDILTNQTVMDGELQSILADTNTMDSRTTSIVNQTSQILSTIDAPVTNYLTSILEDTKTTIPATLSDLNSGLDLTFTRVQSILVDTGSTLLNLETSTVNYASQALSTIDAGIVTTIGNKITSILVDTGSTLNNLGTSIVEDTSKIASSLTATLPDSIWDEAMEAGYTAREYMRLMAACLFGKTSGGGTGTVTFRDTADGINRIVATVDVNKNRTGVVLDDTV